MPRVPRPAALATVLACATGPLALASSAAATPAWQPTSTLLVQSPEEPSGESRPAIASDAAGDATVLFLTADPSGGLSSEDHPAGGVWEAPIAIPTYGYAREPQLAENAEGQQTAVWLDSTNGGATYSVWSAQREPGGGWSTPLQLGPLAGGEQEERPAVAVDEAGEAVAMWTEADTKKVAAVRHDGVWGAPQLLGEASYFEERGDESGRLSVSTSGQFIAGWAALENGGEGAVDVDELRDGSWEGAHALESSGEPVTAVSLAQNAAGEAEAVWIGQTEALHSARRSPTGGWSVSEAPGSHVRDGCELTPPQVVLGQAGEATAAWFEETGEAEQLTARGTSAAGVWQAAGERQVISSLPSESYPLRLALDGDGAGDLLLSWSAIELNTQTDVVHAATRPAGGGWSAPSTLSSHAEQVEGPASSDDAEGDGASAWWADEEGSVSELAAGFEQRPVITQLAVPARLSVAQASSFAARVTAPWASVAGVQWRFGDGAAAEGASVTHTYAQPGTYTVTLTATDSLGNAASVSRQVIVTAAASASTSAASPTAAPSSTRPPARLAAVYLKTPGQHLWLATHAHGVNAQIHNSNAFPVSGSVSLYDHFLEAGHAAGGSSAHPISDVVRFTLAAGATGEVHLALSAAALARLRALSPDRGHDLVSVHLAVHGAGQVAHSAVVFALDERLTPARRGRRRPHAGPGYAAPVDPWAHASC